MKVDMKSTEYYKSGRLLENAKKGIEAGRKTQALQAQERISLYLTNPSLCIQCNSDLLYNQRKYKFCSSSCAASYNNIRKKRKNNQPYNCLQCNIECKFGYTD